MDETWSAFALRPYKPGGAAFPGLELRGRHVPKHQDAARQRISLLRIKRSREAALQYVRKVSGYRKPSRRNEAAFQAAVQEVAAATRKMLESLGVGA